MTKKRLINDNKILRKDPHPCFECYPNTDNILEWPFILIGQDDFEGGYFVGKIMHNIAYPQKPPDFMMLTPNGRFLINRKICLSNTGYHANEWSPMWTISAILNGFISIMLDDKENGISHIHYSKEKRKIMAEESVEYNKTNNKEIIKKFTRFLDENGDPKEVVDEPKKKKKDKKEKKEKKIKRRKKIQMMLLQ
jgi:ubiquitin-conjugating enzyme E2 J2